MHKRNVEPSVFPDPNIRRLKWTHDETGEQYKFWSVLVEKYPAHAMNWIDGEFGGYVFSSVEGDFKTLEGVRGIGFKAVLAFDSEGTGFVFVQ